MKVPTTLQEAMQVFTDADWPVEEWPIELWEDAARELMNPDSLHEGDLSSIVSHYGLWN
jgi:hypothetical protein